MALNFGILQPANISGQLQAGQESAMRNQLAQQQLAAGQQQMETGRMQQEKAGLEMQQFKRRQSALDKFLSDAEKGGHTGDPEDVAKSFYDFAITSGDPSVVLAAQQALMAAKERKQYLSERMPGGAPAPNVVSRNEGAPQGIVSKPFTPEQVLEEERRWAQMAMGGSTKGLAPMLDSKGNLLNPMTPERRALDEQRLQQMADGTAGMAMPAVTGRPIQPDQALNVVSRSEGSPSPIPTANMLAPPPAAPVNALAAPAPAAANPAAALQAKIIDLQMRYPSGIAKPEIDMLKAQLTESLKQTDTQREMQALGLPLTPEGFKQYIALKQAPPTQTDLRKNFEFAKTPEGGNYKGSFADFKAISTPKTSVTVSTEKKYGEQFAGKIADSDSNKLGAAEKAPQLAESANRIINLVSQGNLFTGPIADVKLNIARALNVVGASNDEKIANTEALIAATGQSTLDAIKGAGLGTGQGFTDKDLKFLQGIAGGAITYTPQTLTELATLQHRVATRSVENWNRRFKEIPKSATEGLGIQAVPNVPPLSSGAKAAAARPAGVGVDWTFERDAAGNRAWVSPDRKSFKEAQ